MMFISKKKFKELMDEFSKIREDLNEIKRFLNPKESSVKNFLDKHEIKGDKN